MGGGYYAYQRMTENNWNADARDQSWCTNSETKEMMRCADCNQAYGSFHCKPVNNCYSNAGCQFSVPSDLQRDAILKSGFMPLDFTPPFTVTITAIDGADCTQAKVCPVEQPATGGFDTNWKKASEFPTELFMTFTEMDLLGETCGRMPKPTKSCTASSDCGATAAYDCYMGVCVCKPNYCIGLTAASQGTCNIKPGVAGLSSS